MIYKNNKKAPGTFANISKNVIEDKRLSFKERGILIYLLSKPPDWQVNIKDLINQGHGGKSSVQKAMKSLVEFGYAVLKRSQDPLNPGRLLGSRYHIYEEPISRESESPAVGNSDSRGLRNPIIPAVEKVVDIDKKELILKSNSIQKENHTEDFFQKFLKIYEVRETASLRRVWEKISIVDYSKILDHSPKYILANPEKKFRKSARNYLKEEEFLQEIIDRNYEKDTLNGRAGRSASGGNARTHPRSELKKTKYKAC